MKGLFCSNAAKGYVTTQGEIYFLEVSGRCSFEKLAKACTKYWTKLSPWRRVRPAGICLDWSLCCRHFFVDLSQKPRLIVLGRAAVVLRGGGN
ncbi:Protein O-Mannosyl-Transferase Tmtc4 [Manis pentadactyla]|nr:Protein O-Mannosyl-Transferase Tmtc4 [Manis pentadactyla]